jgi:hypothetical protein
MRSNHKGGGADSNTNNHMHSSNCSGIGIDGGPSKIQSPIYNDASDMINPISTNLH